jgi:hypothetical protein
MRSGGKQGSKFKMNVKSEGGKELCCPVVIFAPVAHRFPHGPAHRKMCGNLFAGGRFSTKTADKGNFFGFFFLFIMSEKQLFFKKRQKTGLHFLRTWGII